MNLKPYIYPLIHTRFEPLTLGDRVRLHVSIIVLAGPDKPSLGLHGLSDHVIDETMLIPDLLRFKLSLVVSEMK